VVGGTLGRAGISGWGDDAFVSRCKTLTVKCLVHVFWTGPWRL